VKACLALLVFFTWTAYGQLGPRFYDFENVRDLSDIHIVNFTGRPEGWMGIDGSGNSYGIPAYSGNMLIGRGNVSYWENPWPASSAAAVVYIPGPVGGAGRFGLGSLSYDNIPYNVWTPVGGGFNELYRQVPITAYGPDGFAIFAIDNLQLFIIPEPGSAALIIVGLAPIFFARRKPRVENC
jgi:hypothetical protein